MDSDDIWAVRWAVGHQEYASLRRTLAGQPRLAMAADKWGWLPLHHAASYGDAAAVELLLELAPGGAAATSMHAQTPLHIAVARDSAGRVSAAQLLLRAWPAAAMSADASGYLPLHLAAAGSCADTVQLLLEAAPAAAAVPDVHGRLPLHLALQRWHVGIARCLLAAGDQPLPLLQALRTAPCEAALPLYADLAARLPLSPSEWQLVPAPCPGLVAALPAVLARSHREARQLTARLPLPDRQRLRAAALALAHVQRRGGLALPPVLVQDILAKAAG